MALQAVRVELFGGFRLIQDGSNVFPRVTLRQQELIACIGIHADGAVSPRQQIASCLWPDSTEGQALTNLRREWHGLREAWPAVERVIEGGSRTFAWRSSAPDSLDVHAFAAAATRAERGDRDALHLAAKLYRGLLLPACTSEWIVEFRDRLQQQAIRLMTRLAESLESADESVAALELAQRLIALDPLNESGWRVAMRSHARQGNRAGALQLYQECADLLRRELHTAPGAQTRLTYRQIADLDAAAPAALPSDARSATLPLIGRSTEWSRLLAAWRDTVEGRRRLVVVRGEAGIGKTRLAEELVAWCGSTGVNVATTRCYAGGGRLAYAPVHEWLETAAVQRAAASLDAVWVTELARLTPELLAARPDAGAPSAHLEPWQRTRYYEALARAFHATCPLVLVLDDVQWCDGDTLEWLHYFAQSGSRAPCLVVTTLRSDEEADNAGLRGVLDDIARGSRLVAIDLERLDEAASAELAEAVVRHPLDPVSRARAFARTEGHPLFIVEHGRMDDGGDPALLTPRVQSVVAARLARLSPDARDVAELASAIGRDFRFAVLARASELDEPALVRGLDELWQRQIVRAQSGDRWDFSHDRIREVAYAEIGPARAALLHRRIAQALEDVSSADIDAVSAAIALHLERGGLTAQAIAHLERAAQTALRVSANEECIRCLTHAISLVDALASERERLERELALRTTLSGTLTSARGYAAPEVEANLTRVAQLASQSGAGVPVRWLWSLWTVHFMLGNLAAARAVSEQALARLAIEPAAACEAHHAMAGTLVCMGELDAARTHFAAAWSAYESHGPKWSALGSDLGVFVQAFGAHALWLTGDVEGARVAAESAVALARRLDHVYSETLALAYAALTYQLCGELDRAAGCAQDTVSRCTRYGFAYYGDWAVILLGWVRAQEGHAEEAVESIEGALRRLDAQRGHARRPYYLSLLADAYVIAGRSDEATMLIDHAIALARDRQDVWWLPELLRQRAALANDAPARAALTEGLSIAVAQGSRSLEKRLREFRL